MWSLLGFKSKYKKGESVEVEHPQSRKYVNAVILDIIDNSNYHLKTDDGEVLQKIHGKMIRAPTSLSTPSPSIRPIDSVDQSSKKPLSPESKKIMKQDSMTKQTSDKNIRRASSIGSLQKSPSMSVVNSRRPSVVTNEKKSSAMDRSSTDTPPITRQLATENNEGFLPDIDQTSSTTQQPVQKKKKEKKERGKEEIILLSRVKKCREDRLSAIDISRLNLELIPEELKAISTSIKEITARKNNFKTIEDLRSFHLLTKLDLAYNTFDNYNANFPILPKPATPAAMIVDGGNNNNNNNPDSSNNDQPEGGAPETITASPTHPSKPSSATTTTTTTSALTVERPWLSVIRDLKPLKYLDLSSTGLTSFPLELKSLSKLEVLILRNNQISVIPEWIKELPFLHTLDLSNNLIEIIPFYLQELTSLSDFNVANNPCKNMESLTPELTYLVSKVSKKKRTFFINDQLIFPPFFLFLRGICLWTKTKEKISYTSRSRFVKRFWKKKNLN
jgi:hypothetical protein